MFLKLQNSTPSKAFKAVVFIQIIAFLNILLTKDFLMLLGIQNSIAEVITEVIFLSFSTLYVFYTYLMVRLFTKNPVVLNTVIICFVIGLLMGTIVENPFIDFKIAGKKYYILAVHIFYSVGTITIIYHTILEIFQEEMTTIERLWGSACVYFMIAWAFGGIYDIVCIFDPQALGFAHQLNLSSYLESIAYSISILGNFNPLYEHTSLLISRLAVIEAVWAHLFVVLVVGRLLAK